ncbi:MAG: DUF4255 domain-containing protein [Flavipsychrobacter sp.]|nr:DUF4255 domain-containing protein [Flavipsychrobacter sp.]
MIHSSLSFLKDELNTFITLKDPFNSAGALVNPVVLTNIVDQENHLYKIGGDYVLMTLVNTEEETVGKSQLPYLRTPEDKVHVVNPDIKLNLYIQFSAYSDIVQGVVPPYERSLMLLDQVVYFFQYRNVFTRNEHPALMNAGLEKLIIDQVSLTFEQLNHLWATLGAKYLPSVTYKCRMLAFRESVAAAEAPFITEISIDDKKQKG